MSTVEDIMSTVEDIMSTVEDILSTVGGVQYRRGYHEYRGVILSTVGVFSTVGDIMMHAWGIS